MRGSRRWALDTWSTDQRRRTNVNAACQSDGCVEDDNGHPAVAAKPFCILKSNPVTSRLNLLVGMFLGDFARKLETPVPANKMSSVPFLPSP